MRDALVMDQHPVGNRVVVADDRVDEFVDEGVRLKLECLHRKRYHLPRGRRTGHVGVPDQPRVQTARNALGLRHSS